MVENGQLKDQMDIFKSIPADDSSEQEVESLWRQLMIHESFSSSELAEAKAKRIAAETTRQQAEIESVRNTKALTERMRWKAQNAVEEAEKLREAAASDRSEAAAALNQAVATREQAEAQAALTTQEADARAKAIMLETETQARAKIAESESEARKISDAAKEQADSIIANATKQAEVTMADATTQAKEMTARAEEKAREILETARASAHEQTTELRRQALREIKSVMAHIQEMGAAASEELETQRILTNVAQMRVSASRVERETADQDDDWISSLGLTGSLDEVASTSDAAPETASNESATDRTPQADSKKPRAKKASAKKS